MFLQWLKWNIGTMGWFFELKLSESTLDLFTQLMDEKMAKQKPIELIRI